ncbi:MAG TPA: TRAP transporter large permease subunit [Opitutaceae bacterium]|jgi:tripartite ATP-independent transporter DctM subunit|nr:MAG: Sialic acid TRAP transporter permease protein SiaT [Verrucomicrobia bacterium ADurb.Bin122]HOF10170.1 TRAP transporter large permease subunit [Opitutaceae bacterium]HOY54250.1 TRAP transporter large permease subunit [Opitutaceae bacterium]HPG16795.1 TRAP transporter large permease subunit [Opitutaceae bacterium]HPN99242.1 TRAP transporter large permease subunit [Opitutaceae bacterium]
MSHEMIVLVMFLGMMVLMATGQRVFGMIGFIAVATALLLWGDGAAAMGFNASIKLLNWYPLLTLPMFVFMGYMLSESGIANDLYSMLHVWTGRLRGGLAIGTILLMVLISAMNGLSVAGMAIGCSIAMPEMLKRNYDRRMVSGVIQAGSSLGILVPPSVVFVLYGMIARQPVGQLWLAGVVPGLLMAALFLIYVVVRCRLQPELAPLASEDSMKISLREKLRLLSAGMIPLVIMFIVIGLFLFGITSLVESSAVGALASLLVAWGRRRLTKTVLHNTVRQTLNISAMFMWIIMAALAFGAVFDGLGAVKAIEGLFLNQWGLSPWHVIILMQLSFVIMGMFLDDTAMLVIVAPLYVPLVNAMGFSLVWFGVLYTITCQIAYITPPFGYNLFLMKAMAPKDFPLKDIYASIIPFSALMFVTIVLIMIFPEIALWLPEKFMVK